MSLWNGGTQYIHLGQGYNRSYKQSTNLEHSLQVGLVFIGAFLGLKVKIQTVTLAFR